MVFNQRATQTPAFWQSEFKITGETLEVISNHFIETGEPQSLDEVCLLLIKQMVQVEEEALNAELQQGRVYQPDLEYQVGERLVFAQYEFIPATVLAAKPGYNPVQGDFTVITVQFDVPDKLTAQFSANLKTPHLLSVTTAASDGDDDEESVVEAIYDQFYIPIRTKVESALKNTPEFIEFNNQWFLAELMVDVQEGLLNIVDAAIDINGGPLNADALIEQLELKKNGKITEASRFSVNYRLGHDPRFINVGTPDAVLWYLNRLKPAQSTDQPLYLKLPPAMVFNYTAIPSDLRPFLTEIDDETTPAEYAKQGEFGAKEATLVLTYPHFKSGTLPLLPVVKRLLPKTADRLVALQLIDGQTGDKMLGWLVSRFNYIFGLAPWFTRHGLLVGTYVILRKTEHPLKFIVDYVPQRTQREWVRATSVKNDQLVFQMKKQSLACSYDEQMVIGCEDDEALEALWAKVHRDNPSLVELIIRILPELMKLSSQSAVHVNTLYSAINVIRRCPPGPLLQELAQNPVFVSMGHGYWTYKPTTK